MYAYLPNSNKMKAPDIPGKIIAQIANIPHKKMNHRSVGVWAGVATVM